MAPHIPALAQSESKTRFFQRLGMRTDDVHDKRIYTSMKREAAEGRRRLIDRHAPDATISETEVHREVLQIYAEASPTTKLVYDLGRDRNGVEEENWIIRWLLWHANRYRDQRNNKIRRRTSVAASEDHNDDDLESESDAPDARVATAGTTAAAASSGANVAPSQGSRFYDPVRDA